MKKLNLSETVAYEKTKEMRTAIMRRLKSLGYLTVEIDFSNVVTVSQLLNINTHNVKSELYTHLRDNWMHYEKIGCSKNKSSKITLSYRGFLEILHNFSDDPEVAKIFDVEEMQTENPVLISEEIKSEISDIEKLYLIKENLEAEMAYIKSKLEHIEDTIDILTNYERAKIEAQNIIAEHEGVK